MVNLKSKVSTMEKELSLHSGPSELFFYTNDTLKDKTIELLKEKYGPGYEPEVWAFLPPVMDAAGKRLVFDVGTHDQAGVFERQLDILREMNKIKQSVGVPAYIGAFENELTKEGL